MNTELIANLYKNKSYIEWKIKDNDKSLWDILGKSTNEMCHSRFIKYLFSCDSDPSTSKFAFIQFLRLLVLKNDKNNCHNEILDNIRNSIFLNCNLSIESALLEVSDKNKNSRYDIIFEVELNNIPIKVVIENKVMSPEGDEQTDKYYANFKNRKDTILVLLSIKKVPSINVNFINITYQELLDNVLESTYENTNNQNFKELIKDYIGVLSSNIVATERKVIMAVSSHEKELLKNIYEENKVLFQKMFEVLTEDDDEDKRELLTSLNKINKKFKVNKWLYNGNIYTSKELLKIIIEEQLKQGKSIEDLSKYKLGNDVMVSKNNLREGYYDEYCFGNVAYFVRNNRPSEDIKYIIKDLRLDIEQLEE